jgi:phosphoribosylformylglycinamidine synthase
MPKPKVMILRTAGTNCDIETASAFEAAGGRAELLHVDDLTRNGRLLDDFQILALPGGFTYGDDIASGKILANELKFKIADDLKDFINDGKIIIGICNGFQILVKSGLLPNISGDFGTIEATLTLNDSARFEDRWVYLKQTANSKQQTTRCIWTKGIDRVIEMPVAHGEGKFIPRDRATLEKMKKLGLVALEYVDEKGGRAGYPYCPNGSVENIAGICDPTGRVFGLMPHPERHVSPYQHPLWTRRVRPKYGDGFMIFKNGVDFAKKNL